MTDFNDISKPAALVSNYFYTMIQSFVTSCTKKSVNLGNFVWTFSLIFIWNNIHWFKFIDCMGNTVAVAGLVTSGNCTVKQCRSKQTFDVENRKGKIFSYDLITRYSMWHHIISLIKFA